MIWLSLNTTVGVALCGHPSVIGELGWPQRTTPTVVDYVFILLDVRLGLV
jgi:hypothetical protein